MSRLDLLFGDKAAYQAAKAQREDDRRAKAGKRAAKAEERENRRKRPGRRLGLDESDDDYEDYFGKSSPIAGERRINFSNPDGSVFVGESCEGTGERINFSDPDNSEFDVYQQIRQNEEMSEEMSHGQQEAETAERPALSDEPDSTTSEIVYYDGDEDEEEDGLIYHGEDGVSSDDAALSEELNLCGADEWTAEADYAAESAYTAEADHTADDGGYTNQQESSDSDDETYNEDADDTEELVYGGRYKRHDSLDPSNKPQQHLPQGYNNSESKRALEYSELHDGYIVLFNSARGGAKGGHSTWKPLRLLMEEGYAFADIKSFPMMVCKCTIDSRLIAAPEDVQQIIRAVFWDDAAAYEGILHGKALSEIHNQFSSGGQIQCESPDVAIFVRDHAQNRVEPSRRSEQKQQGTNQSSKPQASQGQSMPAAKPAKSPQGDQRTSNGKQTAPNPKKGQQQPRQQRQPVVQQQPAPQPTSVQQQPQSVKTAVSQTAPAPTSTQQAQPAPTPTRTVTAPAPTSTVASAPAPTSSFPSRRSRR